MAGITLEVAQKKLNLWLEVKTLLQPGKAIQ